MGNQGDPNLNLHRVRAGPDKGLDFQVLFQIFEENLDLPAVFINGGDGCCSQIHMVG